jgi:hypothetical protein
LPDVRHACLIISPAAAVFGSPAFADAHADGYFSVFRHYFSPPALSRCHAIFRHFRFSMFFAFFAIFAETV